MSCIADNEFVFEFRSSTMVYAHWHADAAALTRLITGVGQLLQLWSGVERYCREHLG